MESNNHIVDKRLFIDPLNFPSCDFRCNFCYSLEDSNLTAINSGLNDTVNLNDKLAQFDIISTGCTNELFIDQEKAVNYLSYLSKFNKILTFATRSNLKKETVKELSKINNYLRNKDAFLLAFVSFISGKDILMNQRLLQLKKG